MSEIVAIVQIVIAVIAVAAPAIFLARLLPGDDEARGFEAMWNAPDFDAWPRGVQEPDPVPFRWAASGA